jgi:alpha-N-arabinofuranosidase
VPENNVVYVNVVNRHKDKSIDADIINSSGTFTGKAEVQMITGDSLKEPFAFDKREQYNPVMKEIKVEGKSMRCTFPAHSFTQIQVRVKK